MRQLLARRSADPFQMANNVEARSVGLRAWQMDVDGTMFAVK